MPWGTFFDMDALHSAKVPIVEFKDYVADVGGQKADLIITYATEKKEMPKDVKLSGGLGEFHGFAEGGVESCKSKNRELPEHTQDANSDDLKFVYAGQCSGGIR